MPPEFTPSPSASNGAEARPNEVRFIFNPRSGRDRRRAAVLSQVRKFVEECHLPCSIHFTEAPGHATELAQRACAEGVDRIVAVGGDGTLNEVASALVGTRAAFGIIPCGSGNGLGRHLGIHGRPRTMLQILAAGRIREIDTGVVNGHAFFNVMGTGFDAEISHQFNCLEKRGFLAYARTTLRSLRGYAPKTYGIEVNGETLCTPAFLLSIANSDQFGSNCFIAPGARVDDGVLDLTIIPTAPPLSYLPLGLRLFSKSIHRRDDVICRRASRFRIHRPGPGVIHTDGEVRLTDALLEVEVRPRSLRMVVP